MIIIFDFLSFTHVTQSADTVELNQNSGYSGEIVVYRLQRLKGVKNGRNDKGQQKVEPQMNG